MNPRTPLVTVGLALGLLVAGCAAPSGGDAIGSPASAVELACTLPTNCISSSAGGAYAPLPYEGSAERAMELLRATLAAFPEARIVRAEGPMLEAVFTTPAGFRDDVDFRVDAQRRRIDFRSRSTFGLFDFGKNRSRMQEFAARFEVVARQGR